MEAAAATVAAVFDGGVSWPPPLLRREPESVALPVQPNPPEVILPPHHLAVGDQALCTWLVGRLSVAGAGFIFSWRRRVGERSDARAASDGLVRFQ